MAVFPEKLDRINPENQEQSFNAITDYIHYMCERIEFATKNAVKNIEEAKQQIAKEDVVLEYRLTSIEASVEVLQQSVEALNTALTATQHDIIQRDLAVHRELSDLDDRVTALET